MCRRCPIKKHSRRRIFRRSFKVKNLKGNPAKYSNYILKTNIAAPFLFLVSELLPPPGWALTCTRRWLKCKFGGSRGLSGCLIKCRFFWEKSWSPWVLGVFDVPSLRDLLIRFFFKIGFAVPSWLVLLFWDKVCPTESTQNLVYVTGISSRCCWFHIIFPLRCEQ